MLELLIRGGDVVTPEGVATCDVAIAGERIAAIAAPGAFPTQSAQRTIDASGRIVMPGGIDPHVHLKHVWIKPDGTPLVTAGPDQVGRAALHGGTTTLIDFAYWREGQSALHRPTADYRVRRSPRSCRRRRRYRPAPHRWA